MDKKRMLILRRKQGTFPGTPPPNWPFAHTHTGTDNTSASVGPNANAETEGEEAHEFPNDTWEYSPLPPSTPVDRSRGILRYREPGEMYGRWAGPRKRVRFVEKHHIRYYKKTLTAKIRPVKRARLFDLGSVNEPATAIANQNLNGIAVLEIPEPEMPMLIESSPQPHSSAQQLNSANTTAESPVEGSEQQHEDSEDSLMRNSNLLGVIEINSNVFSPNSENTQGFYQNSDEEIALNMATNSTVPPLCPELIDCGDPIENIVNDLAPREFSAALLQHFLDNGIASIGLLSSLKPSDLQPYSIIPPKAENVRRVLQQHLEAFAFPLPDLQDSQVENEQLELDEEDDDDDGLEEYIEVTSPSTENTDEAVDDAGSMPTLEPMNNFGNEAQNVMESVLEDSQTQLPVLRRCVEEAKAIEGQPNIGVSENERDTPNNETDLQDILIKVAPILLKHRGRKRKNDHLDLEHVWTVKSSNEQTSARTRTATAKRPRRTRKSSSLSSQNNNLTNKSEPASAEGPPEPTEPPSHAAPLPKITQTRNRRHSLQPQPSGSKCPVPPVQAMPGKNEASPSSSHSAPQKEEGTTTTTTGTQNEGSERRKGRRKSAQASSNESREIDPSSSLNLTYEEEDYLLRLRLLRRLQVKLRSSQPAETPAPASYAGITLFPKVIVTDCKKFPPPELTLTAAATKFAESPEKIRIGSPPGHQQQLFDTANHVQHSTQEQEVQNVELLARQTLSNENSDAPSRKEKESPTNILPEVVQEVDSQVENGANFEEMQVSRTLLDSTGHSVNNIRNQQHDENRNRVSLSSPTPAPSSGPCPEAEKLPPIAKAPAHDASDLCESQIPKRNTLEPAVLREIQALIGQTPRDADVDVEAKRREMQVVLPKLLLTHVKVKDSKRRRKHFTEHANANCTESEVRQTIPLQKAEEMKMRAEVDDSEVQRSFPVAQAEEEFEETIGWKQSLDELRSMLPESKIRYLNMVADGFRGLGTESSIELAQRFLQTLSKSTPSM